MSNIGMSFDRFETLSLANLHARCLLHDIKFSGRDGCNRLHILLTKHFGQRLGLQLTGEHCFRFACEMHTNEDLYPEQSFGHLSALIDKSNSRIIVPRPLRRF
jgi:hypothetical protein